MARSTKLPAKSPDDLIDRAGVAEELGVAVDSVSRYRNMYVKGGQWPDRPFPEPVMRFGGSDVWLRADIAEWNAKRPGRTGRPLKAVSAPEVEAALAPANKAAAKKALPAKKAPAGAPNARRTRKATA